MEGKEWTYFWLPMDLLVNQEAYKQAHVLPITQEKALK